MSNESIDWACPWLSAFRQRGSALLPLQSGEPTAARLDRAAGSVLRFVPHHRLAPGEAYEAHVHRTATIPTRDNLHDFFNGLVWLHLPAAKRRLNELQAGEIARLGIGNRRGPLRDALTLFDENGAVLDAPDALWQALLARDWHGLFVTRRALWQEARLLVFGHALLEQLVRPRNALTAHVLCAPQRLRGCGDDLAQWDAALLGALDPGWLASKPFTPLPVLGVPGWWAGNENFSFYDDSQVFRPAGRHKNVELQASCARHPA